MYCVNQKCRTWCSFMIFFKYFNWMDFIRQRHYVLNKYKYNKTKTIKVMNYHQLISSYKCELQLSMQKTGLWFILPGFKKHNGLYGFTSFILKPFKLFTIYFLRGSVNHNPLFFYGKQALLHVTGDIFHIWWTLQELKQKPYWMSSCFAFQ